MRRYSKITENYSPEDDRILYKSDWHTIGLCGDNYEYVDKRRGVCILPYKTESCEQLFLVRMEQNPIYGKNPTCITGMIDDGETPIETSVRELLEEAGILASADRFTEVGSVYAGKDRLTPDVMFVCDVTGLPQNIPIGDGSSDESNSENLWVDRKLLFNIAYNSTDCYLKSILAQLFFAVNS